MMFGLPTDERCLDLSEQDSGELSEAAGAIAQSLTEPTVAERYLVRVATIFSSALPATSTLCADCSDATRQKIP
jgi:hypothetical protein